MVRDASKITQGPAPCSLHLKPLCTMRYCCTTLLVRRVEHQVHGIRPWRVLLDTCRTTRACCTKRTLTAALCALPHRCFDIPLTRITIVTTLNVQPDTKSALQD